MLDLEMLLCEKKSLATAVTSDVYDFGQEHPRSGAYADPIVCVIKFPTAGTGTGDTNSVVFAIEHSDNNSDFTVAVETAKIAGADCKNQMIIPMPVEHKRYVRVKTTVAGTVTGTMTAYLSNSYSLPPVVKKEGIDILPTVD